MSEETDALALASWALISSILEYLAAEGAEQRAEIMALLDRCLLSLERHQAVSRSAGATARARTHVQSLLSDLERS